MMKLESLSHLSERYALYNILLYCIVYDLLFHLTNVYHIVLYDVVSISNSCVCVYFLFLVQLTAFNSIKTSSGTSQAAVFEYEDSAAADSAVSGLDKLEIGEHKLSVQRVPPHAAPLLLQPSINPTPPARPPPPAAKDRLQDLPPTCVIRLSNMTTPQELASDDECMELQEDVAEECNVYGVVRSVVIPRGNGDDGEPRGEEVGMVYVHFTHSEGAAKAKGAIAGRMFNGNIVKATFFPEELFLQQIYLLPENYKIPTDEVEGDVVGDAEGDTVVVQNGDIEYVCYHD